jgi:SAM-dependent methyltransferase
LKVQQETIRDFGEQWLAHPTVDGYFASTDLLRDVCEPLLPMEQIKGSRVAEIGSGQGRIVNMLVAAGAEHVVALEPSDAFSVLSRNVEHHGARVSLVKDTGDALPGDADLDLVFSIGVIHHIPDRALRPGGRMLVWLYGREGNRGYLLLLRPLRLFARALPLPVAKGFVRVLDVPLVAYMALCRVAPLPLRHYLLEVLGRFGPHERRLTVFDQLRPAYAKYYSRQEAVRLMEDAGFTDVRVHHRHAYSWTVCGTRPAPHTTPV